MKSELPLSSAVQRAENRQGPYVVVSKLSSVVGGIAPGDMNTYAMGEINHGVSLPIDYVLEGYEINPPVVGEQYRVFRTIRNGVNMPGVFESTTCTEVFGTAEQGLILFSTLNSTYKIEYK
jgi:hypothetical protein